MFFERAVDGEKWAVVYDKAIREDGSLLFPEKLSQEYLLRQRKSQGSYIYAHQYQNEIIPSEDQDFKKEWIKYYSELPRFKTTFAFIDPAISLENHACYTAVVVIDVDPEGMWYLKMARRVRITATQTIKLIFDLQDIYKCNLIGIESVAYQEALMHFLESEMRKRKRIVPVRGIRRGPDLSKPIRIRSLVPRFEWQRILIKPGLAEFEDEYLKFPRGTYVDILDALSSLEEIVYLPEGERKQELVPNPNSPDYERHYIRELHKKAARAAEEGGD
jgi:phage terminase large subunit-like protein